MKRPDVFHWNLAIDLDNEVGHGRATVLGLALISQQLDYLIHLAERTEVRAERDERNRWAEETEQRTAEQGGGA